MLTRDAYGKKVKDNANITFPLFDTTGLIPILIAIAEASIARAMPIKSIFSILI